MRRLIYSPKCYAFIHSSNLNQVIDVSDDVLSGSVDRVVGDYSTARLTLRNSSKSGSDRGKYIRRAGKQVFLPNDLITIWLQRAAGHPIQQFTGYLDTAPMFELYPRAVDISATCTLKKVAYTWFDPGIQFFQKWANEAGWIFDPATGSAQNYNYNIGGDNNGSTVTVDDLTEAQRMARMDGGFASLLYRFMKEIAGWPEDRLHISNIDPHLPEIAAKKYQEIIGDVVEFEADLVDALRDMMGVSLAGVVDGITPTGSVPGYVDNTLQSMKTALDGSGIPMVLAVLIARLRTNFVPQFSHSQASPAENNNWGMDFMVASLPRSRRCH